MDEQFIRTKYDDRESWLKAKEALHSASEAASVMQISPWVSKVQLWEEKVGLRKREDISGKPGVQRGIDEEPIIREQFIQDHPEFSIYHHPYEILQLKRKPFISCSLDGEITVVGKNFYGLPIGSRGVLQIKTGSYSSKHYLDKWTGSVLPDFYFVQEVQELLVTGWDFAWVQAKLFRIDRTYTRGGNNFYLPDQYETYFLIMANTPEILESMEILEQEVTNFKHDVDIRHCPDIAV
jgi:predicted phage-related endonuclease